MLMAAERGARHGSAPGHRTAGGRLVRCSVLLTLTALGACGSTRSEPPPSGRGSPPVAVPPAPPNPTGDAALDAVPDASAPPAPTTATDAGAGPAAEPNVAAEALDDATLDRRVFRQVLVGALRYPPTRLTWVLFRGAARARLQVFCQVGKPPTQLGMSLNGDENDETRWPAPTMTVYAGARASADPRSYRLSATAGPTETGCGVMPGALVLQCRPEHVSVLSAGAALVPGKRTDGDEKTTARWQPSSRTRVEALGCDLALDGDPAMWRIRHSTREWPLVFAAPREGAPGIEWAHENSDQVVQEGGYRWMPAPH